MENMKKKVWIDKAFRFALPVLKVGVLTVCLITLGFPQMNGQGLSVNGPLTVNGSGAFSGPVSVNGSITCGVKGPGVGDPPFAISLSNNNGGIYLEQIPYYNFNVAKYRTWYIGDYHIYIGQGLRVLSNDVDVKGRLTAKEIQVSLTTWPDYVFKKDYRLMPLKEVGVYVDKNGHLPGVPTEKEVAENGVNLGEMQKIFLTKLEELTLHLIKADNEIDKLKQENKRLEQMILEVSRRVDAKGAR